MKKLISLVAIAAFMLAMAGCAVNANTGSITVTNKTEKAANGLKVGSVNIGYLAAGATTTVYFSKDEASAKVVADGFEKVNSLADGVIDLKVNYFYSFRLYRISGKNYYNIDGDKLNDASAFENLK